MVSAPFPAKVTFRTPQHRIVRDPRHPQDFKTLPCSSATCVRDDCRWLAAEKLAGAVSHVVRARQGVRLLTLSKIPWSDTRRFHDLMLAALRKHSRRDVELLTVVEKHSKGDLVHVHSVVIAPGLSAAEVEGIFAEDVGGNLALSRWSSFRATPFGPQSTGYLVKFAAGDLKQSAQHLVLNKGGLVLASSRGFFRAHGVTNRKDAARNEWKRRKAWMALMAISPSGIGELADCPRPSQIHRLIERRLGEIAAHLRRTLEPWQAHSALAKRVIEVERYLGAHLILRL